MSFFSWKVAVRISGAIHGDGGRFSLPRPSGTSADPARFVSFKINNRHDLQPPSAIHLFFSTSMFSIIFFLTEMRDFANMALRPLPAVRAGQMIRQFSASYGFVRLIN